MCIIFNQEIVGKAGRETMTAKPKDDEYDYLFKGMLGTCSNVQQHIILLVVGVVIRGTLYSPTAHWSYGPIVLRYHVSSWTVSSWTVLGIGLGSGLGLGLLGRRTNGL